MKIVILIISLLFLADICLVSASTPFKCTRSTDTETIEALVHSHEDNIIGYNLCLYIPLVNTLFDSIFISFGKYFLLTMSILFIVKNVIELFYLHHTFPANSFCCSWSHIRHNLRIRVFLGLFETH
ncbi:hypothetical protein RF11_12541 [Thelohanellus kitauei]|uniref:Uncharacterized protein n=1 Tax=Thelohanellus kitauei TaxID=669202 RepID=A0A0C2NHS6_THEKT|nr:hypothetical protein RF11_12541 [Thelohanellus kitauei]